MPDQPAPRTRRSPRITSVPGKLAFIVVWWFGVTPVGWLFGVVAAPVTLALQFQMGWNLTFLIVGAQVFRARGEAVAPVRPWWQATGRGKASRVLGFLTAIGAVSGLISLIVSIVGGVEGDALVLWTTIFFTYAIAAAFYLNSAVRLSASGAGAHSPPSSRARVGSPS